MSPSEISAVVVTKGDRNIANVLANLCQFGEVMVWDNSKEPDMKVLGRYIGALKAQFPVVYVQDDDTIVAANQICSEYQPGKIVCNMPKRWHKAYEGTGISLVGFGAVFDRSLADGAFRPYLSNHPFDEMFKRECDRVFTYLNRDRVVWTEAEIIQLDYSSAPDRMYLQRRTVDDYAEIRRRLAAL